MSDTITRELGRPGESSNRPDQPTTIPSNGPRAVADDEDARGPSMTDELAQTVAYVLGRARKRANAEAAPDDSRAILHVASLFADDLARDGLDGMCFFQAFDEAQR